MPDRIHTMTTQPPDPTTESPSLPPNEAQAIALQATLTDSQPDNSKPSDSQPLEPDTPPTEPQPSYVKLAMRNMVRKRGKSLYHFTLTTVGLLAMLVGLAYLTR